MAKRIKTIGILLLLIVIALPMIDSNVMNEKKQITENINYNILNEQIVYTNIIQDPKGIVYSNKVFYNKGEIVHFTFKNVGEVSFTVQTTNWTIQKLGFNWGDIYAPMSGIYDITLSPGDAYDFSWTQIDQFSEPVRAGVYRIVFTYSSKIATDFFIIRII